MKQLECPGCKKYMVPPIFLCEKGHNICSECRPKLEGCTICRRQLIDSRNVDLENLASNMHYPCVYKSLGCYEMLPMELISRHQVMCPHRPHICPLAQIQKVRCPWEGPRTEVQGHVKVIHDQYIDKSIVKNSGKVQLSNINKDFTYSRVVLSMGQVFLYHLEVENGEFHFAMLYVGPKELASGFHYEMKMYAENEMILVRNVVCSNEENLDAIFSSGKCVSLHMKAIKNFVTQNNELSFEVKVIAADKSGDRMCCSIM